MQSFGFVWTSNYDAVEAFSELRCCNSSTDTRTLYVFSPTATLGDYLARNKQSS